ncbi:MAG TPA: D-alanyl-D-alanine carboxypeptidase/D-alanyl-D-alanine-endopeptidase [Chitinophagaceae bacterium]|nr:D-alanyl-D-alanine carboxypeptidase/D-alanyl-D-alanine-endopeptidase [Chitinophagaceae bacterium]
MKKVFLLITSFLIFGVCVFAQTISQKIQKAWQQFETDPQLKHAISSLYVIDAKTGQVVFDKNSQVGLAPASTQKIITATTAFELLGKDYRYKTELGYDGKLDDDELKGDIIITGSGDPSFGSWRWSTTSEQEITTNFINALTALGIKKINGTIRVFDEGWSSQQTPDGWIEQDVGNYYGAGAVLLNWRENQFDVLLKAGSKIDEPVEIVGYKPKLYHSTYVSEVKSANKGTGDNAYIYQHPNVIRGTIPINENKFEISGSMQDPSREFVSTLTDALEKKGIKIKSENTDNKKILLEHVHFKYTHTSPSLDSLVYWFLKKSINLYGESLIKTLAHEKKGFGSTDGGVEIVKNFWKQKGMDEDELNISDGSGLSPQNRVTTHAQVEILKDARTKDWFPYFFDALPEYNGMKMKSGTIRDVKGFCGYHKAKDGREYIFSFLVNNYNGRTSSVVSKMYKVLDELK